MVHYADITEAKKQAIRTLLKTGRFKILEIAMQEKVSKRTVQRIKKKMNENLEINNGRVGKCGRKRKTSAQTDRIISRNFLNQPTLTPYQQAKQLADAGLSLSHMTIRRRLKEQGFRNCRPEKKPRLTAAMRRKRLEWAKQFENLDSSY